jgi:hypothetical protein
VFEIRKWQVAAICLVALVACREDEQGRVTEHSAGQYQGGAMPALDDAARSGLAERIAHQNF